MSESISPIPQKQVAATLTYTNPVYSGYFADPFVWKYGGEYYAIGTGAFEARGQLDEAEAAATGFSAEMRIFPLLRSDDFVTWRYAGHALLPPDPALGASFWAPEVAYHDGVFYLYYSVGHEDKNHQLRVAASTHPLGPYTDLGEPLLAPRACPFAIDPHPFQDDDGQWYLFYARDFLDTEGGARAGTALAVDRLIGMTRLAGEAQTVLRAHHDWQRFQANRLMYGQVWDWHTLEGPCVRKHDGRYYCFYSGGRWETENYGVDYGVAENVMGPYSDAGNDEGPRVLRTVPGKVFGPGHNAIIVGPDDRTEYIVYHAWDTAMASRRLCLDRLVWTPDGPRCAGPTWTPQTIPTVLEPQELL
ncbi:MAG TPA: glycoside hydrolase family 43 protein [Chthonomonadaceae bacterium]|nr:glycoside hydrolase family 43 protein [Chthonomonadaceae bacterium]